MTTKTKTKRKGRTFAQLSQAAKETARQWFRDSEDDGQLSETLNDDLHDNYGLTECKVYYSLNSCQGDGLCFTGNVNLDDWRKCDADLDAKLTELAGYAGLMGFDAPEFWVKIEHEGNYYHAHSMRLTFEWCNAPESICEPSPSDEVWTADVETLVTDLQAYLTGRAREIARELEKTGYAEIEHRSSDEYIDAGIEANDYRFDRHGEIL